MFVRRSNVEFLELFAIDARGYACEQTTSLLRFWEGDRIANGFFTREQHCSAIVSFN
jgi:hypothetical protein